MIPGKEHVDLIPSQIHLSLRPSTQTRLAFTHPPYLRLTTFAAVLYTLQYVLWTAPNTPWAPAKMPIK